MEGKGKEGKGKGGRGKGKLAKLANLLYLIGTEQENKREESGTRKDRKYFGGEWKKGIRQPSCAYLFFVTYFCL